VSPGPTYNILQREEKTSFAAGDKGLRRSSKQKRTGLRTLERDTLSKGGGRVGGWGVGGKSIALSSRFLPQN